MPPMKSSVDRGGPLDYVTVYPDDYDEHKSYPLIILLHGFGANKDDLSGLAPVIDRKAYLYALPDAPLSLADDPSIRAWYERGGKESPEAVREALAALDGFVREVIARFRVPPDRTLLAGFSQGGAMSLRYGLPRRGAPGFRCPCRSEPHSARIPAPALFDRWARGRSLDW